MFSLIFGAVTPALAKSTREAVIDSYVGEVRITKAGGSKSYQAFVGMTLNQGDHIETGTSSKVVLRIKDHEDEITIDATSSMYISELSENTKGKKSKMKMWAGSLWGKVKTLTGTDDEFTVETPTAVMGVQGTTLLVGVDPATGQSKFYIASGVGKVNKNGDESQNSGSTLLPSQQINLDDDTQAEDYADNTSVADIDDLISNTSNAIIEAILSSKAAIDQENEDYINKLLEDQGTSDNAAEIDRINQNLNNLVGNIVNKAISQGKVEESQIKALIDKINESLDKKLDLSNVKAPELSAQEKAKQAQVKLLEAERQKKQEAEKEKQDQLKKQNEDLLKKLQGQLEKQKQEKKKAEEAAKQKATEEFAKKLTDAAAKLAFEAKQKAIADEKAKQKETKDTADAKATTKATPPVVTPPVVTPPVVNPPSSGGNQNPPVLTPEAVTSKVDGNVEPGEPTILSVSLQNFGDKGVFGAQLHFTYDEAIRYDSSFADSLAQFTSGLFEDQEVVQRIEELTYTCGEKTCHELIVVVTKIAGENLTVTSTNNLLLKLPFGNFSDLSLPVKLSKLIIVDKAGDKKINSIDVSETMIVPGGIEYPE
jgi:hypothetical protein